MVTRNPAGAVSGVCLRGILRDTTSDFKKEGNALLTCVMSHPKALGVWLKKGRVSLRAVTEKQERMGQSFI